jgi:1,4-dihydroxy-2-naphthoate octaprenyltransferase
LVGCYLELRVVPVLLWSFSAITLGSALAWDKAGHAGWMIAAWVIGLLLQGAVAHCVNELTDWRSGTDRDPAPRVLSGGSKVLRAGLLTERDLVWMGTGAAVLATGLGVVVAAERGWWLLVFGAVGIAGAVTYTLPPLAAAYVPFAGEGVAVLCVWACAVGGFAVQAGSISAQVLLVGASHAAFCISMLMFHHYLDRGPDSRAQPPKRTTVVRLGGGGARAYGLAWAGVATGSALLGTLIVDVGLAPTAVAGAVAVVLHARVDLEDPVAVTRAEAIVIGAGIVAAITSSILLAPTLWWVAIVPLVLVPIEGIIAARWLTPALARTPPEPDVPDIPTTAGAA